MIEPIERASLFKGANTVAVFAFYLREFMPIGTVIWFSFSKGYGFIRPDDGSKDTLVRVSAIGRSDFDDLRKGQKLSFDILQDKKSGILSAENLRLLS